MGGIAVLPDIAQRSANQADLVADASDPSTPSYIPLAGGVAAVLALTGGAWYATRRWAK